MMKRHVLILIAVILCIQTVLGAFEVIDKNGKSRNYSLKSLRKQPMQEFKTFRHKDGKDLRETWKGVSFQDWLKKNGITDFQSLRLESSDNYMVRIHKAELDSMPGYFALIHEGKPVDSTEVRIIFPKQREMFWIRDIARIYAEDFKPQPKPAQLFVWDSVSQRMPVVDEPKPFKNIRGYFFADVMTQIFHQESGSVTLVSRDGIRMMLDYPKHLNGAVLEITGEGNVNLKSPAIPAGMWLKDIVYMQVGPYATVSFDYLYRLPYLYKLLGWQGEGKGEEVIKAVTQTQRVKLEELYSPTAVPMTSEDWIELP